MKIIPTDWLMNAGIVGYMRICDLAGKKPDISKTFIEINASDLEFFTEPYFVAVLMRRAKGIFRFRSELFTDIKTKIGNMEFNEIRGRFSEIGDNSFRKIELNYNAFDSTLGSVIEVAENFKEQALNLCDIELLRYPERIKIKHIERIKNKLDDLISKDVKLLQDKSLKFVYIYLQRFYRNKSIIGNPSIGKLERKESFRKVYVESAIQQLNYSVDDKVEQSDGFLCRFCKRNRVLPKEFYDVNSIFAEGMFSTTAITMSFRNFFYNMQPDLFVCHVCELLLICAWAGFSEIPWRFRDEVNNTEYIFVNLPTVDLLWDENKKIQNLYEQSEEEVQGTIYEDIIQDIFARERRTKARWAIENILFVEIKTTARKDQDRPDFRYFHIGQDIAYLFTNDSATKAFRLISGKVESGNIFGLNLRRNVVNRVLAHNSMYPLCHSLVASYLQRKNQYHLRNVFNIIIISSIRSSIAYKIGKGENVYMLESGQIYGILKNIQDEGLKFGSLEYDVRKRKSYILLSMIRNGRVEDFYDILMKIYISENRPVPDSLIGLLNPKDEIGFQARAYAFMSGFLSDNQQG